MKTLMIYESTHHGNTLKLVNAIAESCGADCCDITGEKTEEIDFSQYDLIGIASGIAYGKFYKRIEAFVRDKFPENKDVFLLYTYGRRNSSYANSVREMLKSHGCRVKGEYSCSGFDTFGPLKLIGGVAKGHPTEEEIAAAVRFYRELIPTS